MKFEHTLMLQVNRELLKDDELVQQLEGVTVLSDDDRINEVYLQN